jgi:hypothetical protein
VPDDHKNGLNGTRDVLSGDAPVGKVEKAVTNGEQGKVPFQTTGVAA